jgi:hypothetical protein
MQESNSDQRGYQVRTYVHGAWARVAAVVAAVVLTLAFASSAFAAPTEPTLSLNQLHTILDAAPGGTVSGYLKTVVKGSTITTIPLNVLAITGSETPDSSLILFEATGTLINQYGGIVAGMSGSPIFVNDGGTDKLIGALSYGNYFTLGGMGLATPVELMSRLEDKYPSSVMRLDHAIITRSGVLDRVIVAPNPAAYAGASKTGAFVAKPLTTIYVSGASPQSKIFSGFQKKLASHGVTLGTQHPFGTSPGVGDVSFQTPLVGGASVAAMLTRGDLWVGGVGTVTYGTADTVLAFGHPSNWDGPTSQYMTNAWVDGIWPSQEEPYKIARPTAVRGEVTQDRFSGIMGKINQFPAETTITAHVTNTDTGESTSTAVYVPRKLLNTNDWYGALVPMGLYPAANRLLDTWYVGGSANTTTTIVVGDGTTTHTIVIPNVIDDRYDIADMMVQDSWTAIGGLQETLQNGFENLDIMSVDFEARVSTTRKGAQIVRVDVPGGVKTGLNTAVVSVLAYGHAATQTVEIPFTIPAGVSTRGVLSASASDSMSESEYMDMYYDYEYGGSNRDTIADVVDDLNGTQPGNVIEFSYQPSYSVSYDDEDYPYSYSYSSSSAYSSSPYPTLPKAIETSVATTWAVTGQAEAGTPVIRLRKLRPTVGFSGGTTVIGSVVGPEEIGKVSVYGHRAGTAGESFLGYARVYYFQGNPMFSFSTYGLRTNTTLRFHLDGDDEWASANGYTTIWVKAKVGLTSSAKRISAGRRVTLSSVVLPDSTVGGTVTFQRWASSKKRWISIDSAKLVSTSSGARATISWKPKKGTHKIRASYGGGSTNRAAASGSFRIHVR